MSIFLKEPMEQAYLCYLRTRTESDVAFAWHFGEESLALINKEELSLQICAWNKSDDIYKCNPKNNVEVSDGEGRTYYSLTIQVYEKDGSLSQQNPMSPFHLMKFGIMINGFNYYFIGKNMRDAVCKFINDKDYSLEKLKKEREIEENQREAYFRELKLKRQEEEIEASSRRAYSRALELKKMEEQRDELEKEIKIRQEKAEKLAEQLISESDGSVESEKSKNSNSSEEKSKTRQANKNRDAKKKEKEDYIKHAAECARILAQQEAKKIALKRAKAKAQKK